MLILVWIVRESRMILLTLLSLTFVCGMFRYGNSQDEQLRIESAISQFDGMPIELVGNIVSGKRIESGTRYVVQSTLISGDILNFGESIQVHLYSKDLEKFDIGDRIVVRGEFRALRGPRNPGDFDFKTFYHRRNIWGNVYQNKNSPITVLESKSGFRLDLWIESFRRSVASLFNEKVGGDAAKLMSALLVGLREEIPIEIKQDFADTGVIHVLAVSGLHVGYVLIIFTALTKLFRIPYRWDKIAVIIALVVYAVLTGGKASVWRATIMASFYVVAPFLQRDANLWNIIAAAALSLLIYNPNYMFDLGFLLSFTAVLSIVFFYRQSEKILPERFRVSNIQNGFLKGTAALFIVSLSAQIGTLPFTWAFFNRIPIISLVANVFIVPIIGIIVSIGFAIVLLGSWIPYVGLVFGNAAWLLSEFVFWLTHFFSNIPFAYLEVRTPSFFNILQYIGVVTTLFLIFMPELRKKGVIVFTTTAILIVWPWALQRQTLDVIFLDVGQGDAAVIQIPTDDGRKTILIDAGMKNFRRDVGESVVFPVLKHLGIREIDLLVMSHRHSDHIGGVEYLLKNVSINEVWDSFSNYRSNLYERITNYALRDSIPYHQVYSGIWKADFSPLQIYTLHPDSLLSISERNVNNTSIGMKLVYGDVSFLFVGDLEKEGDEEIVAFNRLLRSDVLKVGHHGSITSSTQHFLNLVNPTYAIISVGERNKFGHPSQEVVTRIRASGAEILRTDRYGAIWFKTDGHQLWVHDWR